METHGEITTDEAKQGWHWCFEFDGLLVGPGMSELRNCQCWPVNHPVYREIPPIAKSLQCYWHFMGWSHVSFGFHVCLSMPNAELHLPFGFVRFGWCEDLPTIREGDIS